MHNKSRTTTTIQMFFFVSFLSITNWVYFGLIIVFASLFLLFTNKIKSLIEDIHVLVLFYLLFFCSLSLSIFSVFLLGTSYIEFYPSMTGRMVNITVYMTIFLCVISRKNQQKITTNNILIAYLAGCYILLAFGIWQILNLLFGVPYPDFNTRNQIHSIDDSSALLPFLTLRITSIAQEPAYLVPYLIDAIIILFYTSKRYISIFLFLILLFFSLSLSGYINILFIIVFMFFLSEKTVKKSVITLLIFPLVIYVAFMLQDTFITVFKRLEPESLFRSGRFQDNILPLRYMVNESSLFNLFFGFGPKGFAYVRTFLFNSRNMMISITSNNIFVDFFVEYGLIGFLTLLMLFWYLYKLAKRTYMLTKNRLSQVLCVNLFVSSMYTSDYASPRFTVMLLIILFLYKDAKRA